MNSIMKNTLLVVDGEPSILELLHFIFGKEYKIVLTSSCYEALIWLEENESPDLIILDFAIKGFGGKDFLRTIKVSGLYRKIPVVVLSETGDFDPIAAEVAYGVDRFFPKPFNPIELKHSVSEIIASKKANGLARIYN